MKLKNLFNKPKDKKKADDTTLLSIQTYQKTLLGDPQLMISIHYQDRSYSTHLIAWNETLVIFESPMQGTDDVILPIDMPLKSYFISRNARYETTFVLTKSQRKDGQLFYVADIATPIVKVQQRQSYRLEILLDVTYDLLDLESPDFAVLCSGSGTCLNISTGGMCLVTELAFASNDQLEVTFKLDNVLFTFIAEVIRDGSLNNKGTYTHGLKFINPDKTDVEKLSRIIFDRQRAQMKRR